MLGYPSILKPLTNKMSSAPLQRNSWSECGTQLHTNSATNHKIGYANVARWMALETDNETHVYRKFDELAARNLLYYQSELLALMTQLDAFDEQDANTDDMDLGDAARTWETLENLST